MGKEGILEIVKKKNNNNNNKKNILKNIIVKLE